MPERYPRKNLLVDRLYYCSVSEDYFYTTDGIGLHWFESRDQAMREVGNFGKPIITIHQYPED